MNRRQVLANKLSNYLSVLATLLLRYANPSLFVLPNSTKTVDISSTPRAIVVTTFSERFFSDCLPLIKALRQAQIIEPIYVVINADFGGDFDVTMRSQFIKELSAIFACYPICSGRPLGMAAVWNLGIRQSGASTIAVLSDDLIFHTEQLKNCIETLLAIAERKKLIILNGSFGHFAITVQCLREVGWFDERFLGFGEEDGDYLWRFEEKYGVSAETVMLSGLSNRSAATGFDVIQTNADNKYSLFNKEFLLQKYEFGPSGSHASRFSQPAKRLLPEDEIYSSDLWRDFHVELLNESRSEVIRQSLSSWIKQKYRMSSPGT